MAKNPATDKISPSEQQNLLFKVSRTFRPAAPLDTRDFFAGRTEQIAQVGQAVHTTGQHAIIFGQRGVGKSSLANIVRILLAEEDNLVVKINCHKDDTFSKIWRNALEEIDLIDERVVGVHGAKVETGGTAAEELDADADPSSVKKILRRLGKHANTVFIFDEFDRLHGSKTQQAFADTIKDLSDSSVNSTLVLVGVGNDVSALIQEHASIDRSVVQIHMPRMKPEELKEIVQKAMRELGTTIHLDPLNLIVTLSQGLPHYTHLIAQEATHQAINARKKNISAADVKSGVDAALKNVQHSILDAYQNAVRGQRKGTLFQYVLLACALADVDEQGYFISAAVRDPMSKIMEEPYEIPGFAQHLDKFSSDPSRGPVLERAGTSRRFRFRFINPLLQPYVIMRGLADGVLQGDLLKILQAKKQPAY